MTTPLTGRKWSSEGVIRVSGEPSSGSPYPSVMVTVLSVTGSVGVDISLLAPRLTVTFAIASTVSNPAVTDPKIV